MRIGTKKFPLKPTTEAERRRHGKWRSKQRKTFALIMNFCSYFVGVSYCWFVIIDTGNMIMLSSAKSISEGGIDFPSEWIFLVLIAFSIGNCFWYRLYLVRFSGNICFQCGESFGSGIWRSFIPRYSTSPQPATAAQKVCFFLQDSLPTQTPQSLLDTRNIFSMSSLGHQFQNNKDHCDEVEQDFKMVVNRCNKNNNNNNKHLTIT